MHIPNGYTEQQVLKIINDILASLAPKYTFGIYGVEDIKQEGFLLSLSALEAYNGSAPLENFLRVHLANRLKTFKRDHSYRINTHCVNCDEFSSDCVACLKRQRTQEIKKNLLSPIDIHGVNAEGENNLFNLDYDTIDLAELSEKINRHLPVEYRKDYLKLKEGAYVPKSRKEEIENLIYKIIETNYE